MAKNLFFVDQDVIDILTHSLRGKGLKYENDHSIYYVMGGPYDDRSSFEPSNKTWKDKNRELFRAKLDELGHPEATVFTHWALEAYDEVHYPELRPEKVISVSLNWMKTHFRTEMIKRKYSPNSGSVIDGLCAISRMFSNKD